MPKTEIEKAVEKERRKIIAWIRKLPIVHEKHPLAKDAKEMKAEILNGIKKRKHHE